MPLVIESSALKHEGAIPREYTCDGRDISPPLAWRDAPEGTKSFALIVDDPDAPDPAAPKRVFVHWVLVDISSDVHALAAGASDRSLPAGAREGKNDMQRTRYGGPCPPIGRHRYYHKLYALDTTFPDLTSPTKAELLAAIAGHILAQAELMGTYQRQG
jgi:Raf kinase inhibitor-like YbhB/YbcL family protein